MQNYGNHAHRPLPTLIGFLFVIAALVAFTLRWAGIGGRATFAVGLLCLTAATIVLLSISRLYITRLQDRIIKLEMRARAQDLLNADERQALAELTNKQIAALRFASDGELPTLVTRAAREGLKPDAIKRAITTWVPDHDRT